MIEYKPNENIFKSNAEALVNPVNTIGVMGSGLARQFKERYPEMFKDYKINCDQKNIKIGVLHIYRTINKLIINFPTKQDWKNNTKIEWIEEGLIYFAKNYKKLKIDSIAFPKLGCGKGGLDWNLVRPLMEKYLKDLDLKIEIWI